MEREQFKQIINNLEARLNACTEYLGNIDSIDSLTIGQIKAIYEFCKTEQSLMDQIKHNELYHILGMGKLTVIQQMKFISLIKKYLAFSSTIKYCASCLKSISLDKTYDLPNTAEYKLSVLGDFSLKARFKAGEPPVVDIDQDSCDNETPEIAEIPNITLQPKHPKVYSLRANHATTDIIFSKDKLVEFTNLWNINTGYANTPQQIAQACIQGGGLSGWDWSVSKSNYVAHARSGKAKLALIKFINV